MQMTTRPLSGSALLALLLAGAFAPRAEALFIDFEAQGNTEVLTNQFLSDGLVFGNAVVLEAGSTLNEFDFPPSSGVHAITGLSNGALVLNLVDPVAHPYDSVSFHLTTYGDALVKIFDATNTLLSAVTVGSNTGSGSAFSYVSAAVLGRVEISDSSGTSAFLQTLDDLALSGPSPVPVPEPGTLGLLGAGLLVAALSRRRRRSPS
jgi:PEP-CTERM motif